MTTAQTIRYERRRAQEQREREARAYTAKAILFLVFLLVAFGIAGAVDYQDRTSDLAGRPVSMGWQ